MRSTNTALQNNNKTIPRQNLHCTHKKSYFMTKLVHHTTTILLKKIARTSRRTTSKNIQKQLVLPTSKKYFLTKSVLHTSKILLPKIVITSRRTTSKTIQRQLVLHTSKIISRTNWYFTSQKYFFKNIPQQKKPQQSVYFTTKKTIVHN